MLVRLTEMIEKNAATMADELKTRLLSEQGTSSFQALDDRTLYDNIFQTYSRLGYWLLRDSDRGEVPIYYADLGKQRFKEGFPLHEIIQAQIATKRHIWDTILEKGVLGTAKELDSVVDFITVLNRFFDMSIYHAGLGYYGALCEQIEY